MKIFLKILKIFGITVGSLFVLLLILPFIFKKPIEKIVKQEINNMVDAYVDYGDFSLSFIRNFPQLNISLENLSVVGKNHFEGDTLLAIKEFSVAVDIMKAINGEISVNSILIDKPYIHGIQDSLKANWDIMLSDTTKVAVVDTAVVAEAPQDTVASSFKLALESFIIRNAVIKYDDIPGKMSAVIDNFNLSLRGNMTGDITELSLKTSIEKLMFSMDNVRYANNIRFSFESDIEADLTQNIYTLAENTLDINGLILNVNGSVALKEKSTYVDLGIVTPSTDFKTVLNLLPPPLKKDLANIKTSGNFGLKITAKGDYVDTEHLPQFDLLFFIENGFLQYPDLPKSIKNIGLKLHVFNPGKNVDATTVDLSKFHFELGENPFDITAFYHQPDVRTTLKGVLDIQSLKEAIPMESMNVSGILSLDFKLSTTLTAIEKEDYENIEALGNIGLQTFSFVDKTIVPYAVEIPKAELSVSPKYLSINTLQCKIDKSDFTLQGKIEQYLSYVLKDGTLKGTLSHQSKLIDANFFLADDGTSKPVESQPEIKDTVKATGSEEGIDIPKNLDLTFVTQIGNLLYDKMDIKNVYGKVMVKNGKAYLDNLKLGLCEGQINISGEFDPTQKKEPKADLKLNLQNIDIQSLTNSLSFIDSLFPIAKKTYGQLSFSMSVNTGLTPDLSPIFKTLNSTGSLSTQNIALKGAEFQNKLSETLKNEKYKECNITDLSAKFKIKDGNIEFEPFKVKTLGKELTVTAKQSLDLITDVKINLPVSRKELNSIIGISGIKINENGADIPVSILIQGETMKAKVSIGLEDAKKALLGSAGDIAKEKLEEAKTQAIEKAKEVATEKIEEVKQKAAEEVQKQTEVVKEKAADEAKKAIGNILKR